MKENVIIRSMLQGIKWDKGRKAGETAEEGEVELTSSRKACSSAYNFS